MIKQNQEKGVVLVLVILVVAIVSISTVLTIAGSQAFYQNSNYTYNVEKAQILAEAGVDKAVASLNKSGGSYNGEAETILGDGSYSVTITSLNATTKVVQSTGYIPSKANAKVKRTVKIQISTGTGISFVYGMLVGNGGITMGNGSTIGGSIYSNGTISGGNNELITGEAIVAGGTQPLADQQNDCASPNCGDFIFGKTVSGNSQLDVAQSFKPSTTAVLNKISLKLKKVGTPTNPTIKILTDNAGSPNKNGVLVSTPLDASKVSPQDYDFIDVTFGSSPTLSANTTYWIMIAAGSLDNSNYWYWRNDLAASYNGGVPAWSSDWQARNPVWSSVSGDLSFKTYMGGVVTSLSMGNGSIIQESVHANTINNVTINKDAYYQTISSSTVKGTSHSNYPDSPPVAMPISSANITDWQNLASLAGNISDTDITGCPATIGPGVIHGSFTTSNSCTIKVKTPIWITGNLTVGNSIIFQMDPSLGSSSGVMIVDGVSTFSNSDDLKGTGISGSYLTLLSTYNSQANNIAAINTGNSSITGILYAPFGLLSLANTANFKEAVAWQINMGTGTTLTYDSGLINTFFSTGPGGSFSAMKGTYTAN